MRDLPLRFLAVAATIVLPPALPAQLTPEARLARHDELVAAEHAAADSARQRGLAGALAAAGSPDLVLLYPGAPVVAGREAVGRLLAAQEKLKAIRLSWVPLHAEVSGDGAFGVSYGVTAAVTMGESDAISLLRFGKYLSAWRRETTGWTLVAHALVGPPLAGDVQLASDLAAPLPPLARSGPRAAFAAADSRFSEQAGRDGAAAAFAAFATDDAVTFAGSGELLRGPDAIGRALKETDPPSHWSWHPVFADGAAGGDLGITVGEAVIVGQGEDGQPSTYYGKYLTLWRRDAGGNIRFLADGGNARPADIRGAR